MNTNNIAHNIYKCINEAFDFQNVDDNDISTTYNFIKSQLFLNEFIEKYLPIWDFSDKASSMIDTQKKTLKAINTNIPYTYNFIAEHPKYGNVEIGTFTLKGKNIDIKFNRNYTWIANKTPTNDAIGYNYNLEYLFQMAIIMAKDGKYNLNSIELEDHEIAFHKNKLAPWTVNISADDIQYFPKYIINTTTHSIPSIYLTYCTFKDEESINAFTKYLNTMVEKSNPTDFSVKHCRMYGEPAFAWGRNTGATSKLIRKYITKNVKNRYKKERMTAKKKQEYHDAQIAKGNWDYMY